MAAAGFSDLTGPVIAQVSPAASVVNLYEQGASGMSALTSSNFSSSSVLAGSIKYFKQ